MVFPIKVCLLLAYLITHINSSGYVVMCALPHSLFKGENPILSTDLAPRD